MATLVIVQRFTASRFLLSASRCRQNIGMVTRRNFSPLAWYNKQLEKAPIITKSITSGGEESKYINLEQNSVCLSTELWVGHTYAYS